MRQMNCIFEKNSLKFGEKTKGFWKTQCYGVSLTQWDSIIGQIVLKITLVSEKTHLTNDLSRVRIFFRCNLLLPRWWRSENGRMVVPSTSTTTTTTTRLRTASLLPVAVLAWISMSPDQMTKTTLTSLSGGFSTVKTCGLQFFYKFVTFVNLDFKCESFLF